MDVAASISTSWLHENNADLPGRCGVFTGRWRQGCHGHGPADGGHELVGSLDDPCASGRPAGHPLAGNQHRPMSWPLLARTRNADVAWMAGDCDRDHQCAWSGGAVSAQSAKGWLGGILVAYGIWGLWRPHLPDLSLSSKWLSLIAGVGTGFVTALTAVFVLPWVPYLQTLRLNKDEMVQALGLSFTVATLALAVRVQMSAPIESASSSVAVAVVGALIGAFGGLKLGELLRGRFAGPTFQKALFMVFLGLGAANLIQAR